VHVDAARRELPAQRLGLELAAAFEAA